MSKNNQNSKSTGRIVMAVLAVVIILAMILSTIRF